MILKLLYGQQDKIIFHFMVLKCYSENQFTLDIPKEIINYINFMYIQVKKDLLIISKMSIYPQSKCISKKCYERLEELMSKSECIPYKGHQLEYCNQIHCYYCHTIFCRYNYLFESINNRGGICCMCRNHVCITCINSGKGFIGGKGGIGKDYYCNGCDIQNIETEMKKYFDNLEHRFSHIGYIKK